MSGRPVLGWVLLLLCSPEAECHDLDALGAPWKHQVKVVHGVSRVFSDPVGSNRYSVEVID